MSDLPVYSPSETDDYLLCPRLRVLKRTLRPRGCGGWTPNVALGNAIHAGLACHYAKGSMDPYTVAAETMHNEYVEGSEWSEEGCQKLVSRGLKAALATELVSEQGSVVGTEIWMAHSKIDMVTREPFGLVVTDHKCSLELEKRRLEYKVREHDPAWQLLHGAWAVWQKYGEVPRWSRAHFIAIGPRAFTYIHSIEITEERLRDFERSGIEHWHTMDTQAWDFRENRVLPPMNTRSCWQYGRKCDFYPICNQYGGNLDKASVEYDPKEAK